MSGVSLRKSFLKAASGIFVALVMFAGTGLAPPFQPRAEASGATDAFTIINMRNHENQKKSVLSAMLVNPTGDNIKAAIDCYALTPDKLPFVRETIGEMNLPSGLKAEEVTEELRQTFLNALAEKSLIAQATAPTPEAAEKLGLNDSFSRHLAEVQTELGITPGQHITIAQAQTAIGLMEKKHWQEDVKPVVPYAAGATVLLAAGVGSAALWRKRTGPV